MFRSKNQQREWEKRPDRSTPEIRRLLDKFEEVRPYQAPFKLVSDSAYPCLSLLVILRSPGWGYFGIMPIRVEQIEEEVAEHEAGKAQDIVNHCGAFI